MNSDKMEDLIEKIQNNEAETNDRNMILFGGD